MKAGRGARAGGQAGAPEPKPELFRISVLLPCQPCETMVLHARDTMVRSQEGAPLLSQLLFLAPPFFFLLQGRHLHRLLRYLAYANQAPAPRPLSPGRQTDGAQITGLDRNLMLGKGGWRLPPRCCRPRPRANSEPSSEPPDPPVFLILDQMYLKAWEIGSRRDWHCHLAKFLVPLERTVSTISFGPLGAGESTPGRRDAVWLH